MSIVIRGLCKSFGSKTILKDLDAEFRENRITCLMGPSGAGKTTLLRILMGLETPDAGTVEGVPELRSAVFQEDRLFDGFGALENVLAVSPALTDEADVRRHFAMVGLGVPESGNGSPDSGNGSSEGSDVFLTKPVRLLSGGERRRVALVRAIFAESDVLFLDEPFDGLDSDTKRKAIDYLRTYAAGKTVILVTHNTDEAVALADETVSLAFHRRKE